MRNEDIEEGRWVESGVISSVLAFSTASWDYDGANKGEGGAAREAGLFGPNYGPAVPVLFHFFPSRPGSSTVPGL